MKEIFKEEINNDFERLFFLQQNSLNLLDKKEIISGKFLQALDYHPQISKTYNSANKQKVTVFFPLLL